MFHSLRCSIKHLQQPQRKRPDVKEATERDIMYKILVLLVCVQEIAMDDFSVLSNSFFNLRYRPLYGGQALSLSKK